MGTRPISLCFEMELPTFCVLMDSEVCPNRLEILLSNFLKEAELTWHLDIEMLISQPGGHPPTRSSV